jgi:hypothetical protein
MNIWETDDPLPDEDKFNTLECSCCGIDIDQQGRFSYCWYDGRRGEGDLLTSCEGVLCIGCMRTVHPGYKNCENETGWVHIEGRYYCPDHHPHQSSD